MERYVVLRATLERLVDGISLRRYAWMKNIPSVETFVIDLALERVTIRIGKNDRVEIAEGSSNHRSLWCEETEEDHHDIYPLTVMLIRAVGIPVESYYLRYVWLGAPHNHPLFEKQLLGVIVRFL